MSKISIQGGATGTATFTIEAPTTSTNRTLTLPDNTGTVLSSASDIEAQVKTATNASGSAPIYACRAWINYKGTTTRSIRGSGNVSSVTFNGTGDYTVNFTTAMPDGNYSVVGAVGDPNNSTNFGGIYPRTDATASCRVVAYTGNNSFDPGSLMLAFFR